MRRSPVFVLLFAALLGTSCSLPNSGSNNPPPRQAGAGLRCGSGDHGLTEQALGWGFCYPGTWRFRERLQPSDQPPGVDTAFDIVNATPAGDPTSGLFGFMVIGSYDRGSSATLKDWLAANVDPKLVTKPVPWANAVDAAYDPAGDTWYALTAHHVVMLQPRSGSGNLNVDSAMSERLANWRFTD